MNRCCFIYYIYRQILIEIISFKSADVARANVARADDVDAIVYLFLFSLSGWELSTF